MILDRDFYSQNATLVARQLLGATLVSIINGQRVSGRIVEMEAYTGLDDLASHGRVKKTPRNLPMWETTGHAYVYLIYGMYWLLNVTCEPVDQPAAALIRAIEPLEGLDIMAANRAGRPQREWTNGPGRLTQAIGVSYQHNLFDMTEPSNGLWIEAGLAVSDTDVSAGPRIGLGKRVHEPWYSIAWRWWITGNPWVSITK